MDTLHNRRQISHIERTNTLKFRWIQFLQTIYSLIQLSLFIFLRKQKIIISNEAFHRPFFNLLQHLPKIISKMHQNDWKLIFIWTILSLPWLKIKLYLPLTQLFFLLNQHIVNLIRTIQNFMLPRHQKDYKTISFHLIQQNQKRINGTGIYINILY